MLIVVQAGPSVRNLCPPEYLEGKWVEVDHLPKEIKAGAFEGRPTGKMARRETDLMSAPVFELRRPEEWEHGIAASNDAGYVWCKCSPTHARTEESFREHLKETGGQ